MKLIASQDVPAKGKPAGDAFEDVLYGSESELDDSDEEDDRHAAPKRKGQAGGVRLRADNDNPMDLLSGAASRITSKFISAILLFDNLTLVR